MGSDDEIIFYQDDFMSKSFEVFEDMRRKEELVDFKINLESRSIIGHRLVLAARIPHFRKIFCNAEAEVSLEEVDPGVLESVIDYAYRGKIKINPGNVVKLISVSKMLQLLQVYDACWEYLKRRFQSKNVLEFRKLAEDHGCKTFLEAADKYIGQNFEELTSSEGFVDLSFHQLKEIISRDDIKVSTEEKVFEAVMRWIKSSLSERRDFLPELLSTVRMYFLTPHYLIRRVSAEELVRSSPLCSELVEEVKSYHLLPDERFKFFRLQSQPRFYETKAVSPPESFQPAQMHMHHLSADVGPRRSLIYSVYGKDRVIYVKQFEPEGERWLDISSYEVSSHLKPLPKAVLCLDEMIYIFAPPFVSTFELSTKQWSYFSCDDIDGSRSVAYKDKIYFFGSDIPKAKVQYFDLKNKMFLEEGPMKREVSSPGVALLSPAGGNSSTSETFIYVTGGYLGEHAVYRDVDRYNPETKKWSKVPPMFCRRYEHGCCDLKEKIYVCGGDEDNDTLYSSAEMFDPLTNQWSLIACMKEIMFSLSVTSHEDKLYVSGNRPIRSDHHDKLEIYDPVRDEWRISARASPNERGRVGEIFLVKSYDIQS